MSKKSKSSRLELPPMGYQEAATLTKHKKKIQECLAELESNKDLENTTLVVTLLNKTCEAFKEYGERRLRINGITEELSRYSSFLSSLLKDESLLEGWTEENILFVSTAMEEWDKVFKDNDLHLMAFRGREKFVQFYNTLIKRYKTLTNPDENVVDTLPITASSILENFNSLKEKKIEEGLEHFNKENGGGCAGYLYKGVHKKNMSDPPYKFLYRVNIEDVFTQFGNLEIIIQYHGPDPNDIESIFGQRLKDVVDVIHTLQAKVTRLPRTHASYIDLSSQTRCPLDFDCNSSYFYTRIFDLLGESINELKNKKDPSLSSLVYPTFTLFLEFVVWLEKAIGSY